MAFSNNCVSAFSSCAQDSAFPDVTRFLRSRGCAKECGNHVTVLVHFNWMSVSKPFSGKPETTHAL